MPERCLLIRVGGIGDTLQAASVAGRIRRARPDTAVDFLAAVDVRELVVMVPEVDNVYSLPHPRIPLDLHPAWPALSRALNRNGYDWVFLMETSPRYGPVLRGIRAGRRIALHEVEREKGREPDVPNPVRYQQALVRAGLVPEGPVFRTRLTVGPWASKEAARLLASLLPGREGPLIGLHPGNSFRSRKVFRRWIGRADLRSWPEEHWAALILGLHGKDSRLGFVLAGGPGDRATNRRIAVSVRRRAPGIPLADAAGRTDLQQTAALLRRFALFVSTDTGPLHMAAALGVPFVALYGPTRFAETQALPVEPVGEILRASLPCQPCYGTPLQKTCGENACMRSIGPESVIDLARSVRPGLFDDGDAQGEDGE